MRYHDLAVKIVIFTVACAVCMIISEAQSKAFETALKFAFAFGYGALAWEATLQERMTEATICNCMMAVYLTAALQFSLPFVVEQVAILWEANSVGFSLPVSAQEAE